MKDVIKVGIIILSIVALGYIIFLSECRRPTECPPKGQMLIAQNVWDSIKALADRPDSIRIDTVIIIKKIKVPTPQPNLPVPIDWNIDDTATVVDGYPISEINMYKDSLVNKEIQVWVDYGVHGTLLSREWRYSPVTMEIMKEVIKYVPKIVEVEKLVNLPVNSLYATLVFGGNKTAFLFGGGLDYLTKKDNGIGYQYQRYGELNFHSVKIGRRFKL